MGDVVRLNSLLKNEEKTDFLRAAIFGGDLDRYIALAAELDIEIEAQILEQVLVDEYLSPGSAVHPRALVFLVGRVRTASKGFHDRFAVRAFCGNQRIEAYGRICEHLESGDRRSAHDRFMEHIGSFICSEKGLSGPGRTPADVGRVSVADLVLHEASEMAYFAALEDREDFLDFFAGQRYAAGIEGSIEAMVLRKAKDRSCSFSYKIACHLVGRQEIEEEASGDHQMRRLEYA